MARRVIEVKEHGKEKGKAKSIFLFVAEGKNKTETMYFSNFQRKENDFVIRFAKAGKKTDAVSLYETMLAKWKEWELSGENGDRGFILVDVDNDSQKASEIAKLISKNSNACIEFIVSNPTFEIWFLLHFKYTTKQYSNGKEVITDLKRYISDYAKNADCYGVCFDKMQTGISNSKKLALQHKDKAWPSVQCNPRTDVGILVEMICEKMQLFKG